MTKSLKRVAPTVRQEQRRQRRLYREASGIKSNYDMFAAKGMLIADRGSNYAADQIVLTTQLVNNQLSDAEKERAQLERRLSQVLNKMHTKIRKATKATEVK